ncbi:MAG: methyltransferase domain-containing protein [Phycisphaeraceae bacterium]
MSTYTESVEKARSYYNSTDADLFYFTIWGGEDIHIGLYHSDEEPIFDASRRTVDRMIQKAAPIDENTRVLDLGGGFGGAMRYLAKKYGAHCTVLNLSEVENERDREMNKEQGVEDRVEVLDGNFADIPRGDAEFDLVWSQDAILHSDNRGKVIEEAARVLKPGGMLVMTDPMQVDDATGEGLQPIYDRIHLDSLASPGFYKQAAEKAGLIVVEFEEHAEQVARHYGRVLKELQGREGELQEAGVSDDYIQRMKKGLQHWVQGSHNGLLTWGILVFKKPA